MFRKIISTIFIITGILIFLGLAFGAEQTASSDIAKAGKYIGMGLAIGLTGIGTGLAQSRIGPAGIGAISEDRSMFGPVITLFVIPETIIIFGFVVMFLIMVQ
ncbi:MAG: F0F1 ATP synthase subunit C [candidate division WOR-3 bacterium]